MRLSTARKYRRSHRFWRDLHTDNPALVMGVELPFLIVGANTLMNAAALSIMMFFVHMVTMLIARLFTIRLPLAQRAVINVAVSTVMMLIAREICIALFPNIMMHLGIYLYLMAVNGLTLIQANTRRGPTKLPRVLARSIVDIVAFAGLMFAIALVREYFGNGTVWGTPVPIPFRQTAILYPFFGFILTGFLLAFLRRVNKIMVAMKIAEAERTEDAYGRA